MTDLTALTDTEFTQMKADVAAEEARRNRLAAVRGQFGGYVESYQSAGGDKADLLALIDESYNT